MHGNQRRVALVELGCGRRPRGRAGIWRLM
jgi:hypothetical protein